MIELNGKKLCIIKEAEENAGKKPLQTKAKMFLILGKVIF